MNAASSLMTDALRLTKSGKLQEATLLIQASLSGVAPYSARDANTREIIIDTPFSPSVLALPPDVSRAEQKAEMAAKLHDDGLFEECLYTGPEGRIAYLLYVPPGAREGLPLVVMLHGCTQGPEDFARGTGMNALAAEMGFMVAYPRQTSAANMQRCWNWFKPGDQERGKGEPALIAAMTRQILSDRNAESRHVYVAGLSAGGAAAAILGATYPDIYAAIGVHSGLACGAARDMPSAFAAMRDGPPKSRRSRSDQFVPVITFHGDRDTTVSEKNSASIVADAAHRRGPDLVVCQESGGSGRERRFTREMHSDPSGRIVVERWTVHGAGHAWSGGHSSGTYTDPIGPDASRAMIAFFLRHSLTKHA